MITRLEHCKPDLNCHRYYRTEVSRDLFGAWTLRRSWGRIGTRGRDRIDSYSSVEDAKQAQAALCAAKQRRGYAVPVDASLCGLAARPR